MESKKNYYLNFIGMALLGSLSWGYMLWGNYLAEFNLSFSFLDFPIFISEIVLFVCFLLFVIRNHGKNISERPVYLMITGYILFVLLKALYGYFKWGPLALRNAALLYYPFTAVLTCFFYKRDFFKSKNSYLLLMLLFVIFLNIVETKRWIFACSILSFVILFRHKEFLLNKILLFLLLFLLPYPYFFQTSRMMIVSNLMSLLYVAWVVLVIVKAKRVWKWGIAGLIIISVGILLSCFSSKSGILSMLKVDLIRDEYAKANKKYEKQRDYYRPIALRVKVYNPRADSSITDIPSHIARKSSVDHKKMIKEEIESPLKTRVYDQAVEQDQGANLRIGNIVFRIFIWQDMLEDMISKKRILGFDFGKPVRSKRLEVLNWGSTEWRRDGWIAAHNSYLHMIYRTGIVGVALIAFLIGHLLKMIHGFKKRRDLIGLLLCAIIINYFIAANFLLIFELPYTAIPIWSLYGVIMAYHKKLV
ncbi:MAG: hypothetical protein K8S27_13970 [Candidatus Omnitrophica bacterium]|nr:hypothetical protein [Candidatus Omnitrophota bacterium]